MSELRKRIAKLVTYLSGFAKALSIAGLVTFFALSATVLADRYSSIETYEHEIEVLDWQKTKASELSLAAFSSSALISSIPDDSCTPIANQLAGIGKDLAYVTGAILLEKYLLTIFGFFFFRYIVPICCVIGAVYILAPQDNYLVASLLSGSIKILLVSFLIWRSIPLSITIVDMIKETYSATIESAIDSANEINKANDGREAVDKGDASSSSTNGSSGSSGANTDSALERIGQTAEGVGNAVISTVSNVAGGVTGGVSTIIAWAKVVLTSVTEGFAVLVVTSCVVPLLTPCVLVGLVRLFFQPSFTVGTPRPRLKEAK